MANKNIPPILIKTPNMEQITDAQKILELTGITAAVGSNPPREEVGRLLEEIQQATQANVHLFGAAGASLATGADMGLTMALASSITGGENVPDVQSPTTPSQGANSAVKGIS